MVNFIANHADFNTCIKENKKVVVDFTATWCPPCQMIGPKFVAMAPEFPEWTFVKVDVDANEETSQAMGIECMPTFKFFVGGVEVGVLQGADENGIKQKLGSL